MKFNEVIETIITLGKDDSLDFLTRSQRIAHLLDGVAEADILDHLDHAGIIPECFHHDSTEEKLFAKYCDALLAKSLMLIGMSATVIQERADSADVVAELDSYSVVGDAKAFRLSRTAKNQKDFKVESLNTWRKTADYAMLAAPLYQYPKSKSQIYSQAARYNVTLLSYTHLAFLIRNKPPEIKNLEELWKIGKAIAQTKDAAAYWSAIAKGLCEATGKTIVDWEKAVSEMERRLPELAREQIEFWEMEKERITTLSHDEAVNELIVALKIDNKIRTIEQNLS